MTLVSLPRFARDLAVVLAITFVLLSLAVHFVAAPWVVRGRSMDPTLKEGERVLVEFVTYRRREPQPGEVVLLQGPDDAFIVKRVIAGPLPRSETPFLSPFRASDADEDWFVVEGDNPGSSFDSRNFGPVPRHRFRGRVIFRYWPVGRGGSIE